MNKHLENELVMLDIELATLAEASSDKRFNAARRAVIARWNEVVYWLEDEDEDKEPVYCESCGDEVLPGDSDYCPACWDDLNEVILEETA